MERSVHSLLVWLTAAACGSCACIHGMSRIHVYHTFLQPCWSAFPDPIPWNAALGNCSSRPAMVGSSHVHRLALGPLLGQDEARLGDKLVMSPSKEPSLIERGIDYVLNVSTFTPTPCGRYSTYCLQLPPSNPTEESTLLSSAAPTLPACRLSQMSVNAPTVEAL